MGTPAVSMHDPTTDRAPCRRRWTPLSLLIFVAIIVVVCLSSALLVGVPAYRQYTAIQAITRQGGRVTMGGGRFLLPRTLGDAPKQMFEQVHWVSFGAATDETLVHLTRLRGVHYVDLSNARVTDRGLANLKLQTSLMWLCLDNTQVTDAGLRHLKELTNMKMLLLSNTLVTDAGVSELKNALPGLNINR